METFIAILKAFPLFVQLVNEAIQAIKAAGAQMEKNARLKELAEGLKEARETKSTKRLEDFFNPKPR